jgi:hypothetical protein
MDAGRMEQRGDLQEGTAVFLFGRRVHDDSRRLIGQPDPEVAPETGVGRGGFDREIAIGELRCEELLDPVP